ncbi:cytochrome C [Methylovorus sp. MM2]|uniref:c-type cytochrome n=1 Tax=Methylovorus sp. MM2 TaxID=1848038 RepID=UPI0007DF2969|nr:c-type cytochrome [Methylovorus sp. MM2]OAM51651.1 cytochrome C [Methylovorus sp. MM2]
MKGVLLTIVSASSFMMAGQALAVDAKVAEALAQKNGCLACHSVAVKVIGPSYQDVATKYRGDKTAEAKLIAKVKEGGSGVWGPLRMPPNSPHVKDEDIKIVVQWVLSL